MGVPLRSRGLATAAWRRLLVRGGGRGGGEGGGQGCRPSGASAGAIGAHGTQQRMMSSGVDGARQPGAAEAAAAAAQAGVKPDAFCLDMVRQGDKAAYLSGLLMPRNARRAFFAVRALNVELARVAETTHGNELSAQLRFQWWRDLVGFAFSGQDTISQTKSHPVAVELRRAVQAHGLTRRWLDRLVDAREEDLALVQPTSIEEMETYAEQTASSLLYLQLEMVDVRDAKADHAASHLGKGVGIATSLHALPFLHAHGIVRLPRDVMVKHRLRRRTLGQVVDNALTLQGVVSAKDSKDEQGKEADGAAEGLQEQLSSEHKGKDDDVTSKWSGIIAPSVKMQQPAAGDVKAPKRPEEGEEEAEPMFVNSGLALDAVDIGTSHKALVEVTFEVASVAHGHMEHAREIPDLPPGASKAFLSATSASIFLQRLEQVNFDILHPSLRADPFSQLRLQYHLFRNSWGGKF